jgi:putative ABC transport system permease protein
VSKLLLAARLIVGDLRRHPGQAVLQVLAITAAAATLSVGLAASFVNNNPYNQTRTSTNGPDIVSYTTNGASGLDVLERWAKLPGVTAHSAIYPVARPVLRAGGHVDAVFAIGRPTTPTAIDQPEVTDGNWIRPGDIVVERSFADALGITVGQTVTLDGHPYRVSGIAVSAAAPVYPLTANFFRPGGAPRGFPNPGIVWLTEPAASSLATADVPLAYMSELKLADPAGSYAFQLPGLELPSVARVVWQDIRDQDNLVIVQVRNLLDIASTLLVLLAVASVTILVGGRMAEQRRRVGLLKAVGATTKLIAAILLGESLLLALVAAATGLAVGQLVAPLVTGPSAGLVGSAGTGVLTGPTIGIVIGVALAVAALATCIPVVRATRTSTIDALADAARPPKRRRRTSAISARLPAPLLLGLRLATRRLWRTVLNALGTAVTVSAIVAALAARSHAAAQTHGLPDPQTARLDQVLLVVSVVLVVLAVVDALIITWAATLDARRPLAIARAIGAGPEQAAAALSAAQLLPALAGTLLGIPGGIGLYAVAKKGASTATVVPSAWAIAAVVVVTLAVSTTMLAAPAGLELRRPVADALRLEDA